MSKHNEKALYSDCGVRALTHQPSATNRAHQIWYSSLSPMQRLAVLEKVKIDLSASQKLNACLNYIEDNLDQFEGMIMTEQVSSLMNTSVTDAKISLDNLVSKNPEKAKRLAEGIIKAIGDSGSQTSRKKMAEAIVRKANKALN